MENIKIWAENEKEQETFIHTIIIYNQYIGVGVEKCVIFIMKKGKSKMTGEIEWLSQESILISWRKREVQIPGNIESRCHQANMKEEVRKEYPRRTRKLLETKLMQIAHQTNKYLDCSTFKILWILHKTDNGGKHTYGLLNKEIDDDAA